MFFKFCLPKATILVKAVVVPATKSAALVRAIPTYKSKQKMKLYSRISHKQHVVLTLTLPTWRIW
jgi:hypothetical protein